jgi:hypothetical protein
LQQTGSLINVLGQRAGHNLFLVDGTNITDEYYNNVVLNPSPDATQEFIINKTNYEAEFGGKSGAVINVVTKSGTNSYHGSAYEFLRNDAVDAENYFALKNEPVPAYKENQFGGALGGPIVKDRTFFFVNYDGQRLRQDLAHLFTVPTAAQRAGAIGTTPVTGAFDPAAVALLNPALVPLPNLPGTSNNLLEESEQSFDSNQYNVRLDQRVSSSDYVFARAASERGTASGVWAHSEHPHRRPDYRRDAHLLGKSFERVPVRLDEGLRRTGRSQCGQSLRGNVRTEGDHDESGRSGLSADQPEQ